MKDGEGEMQSLSLLILFHSGEVDGPWERH